MKHLFLNRMMDAGTNTGGGTDVFASWEAFLGTIGTNISATGASLNKIVQGLNPSGLTADEVAQLTSDLSNLATQSSNLGAAASAAAANAGQGQPATQPGANSGSTN